MLELSFSQYQEAMKPFFDLIKGIVQGVKDYGPTVVGGTAIAGGGAFLIKKAGEQMIEGYKGAKRMIGEGINGAVAYVQNREPNNPLQEARSPIKVEIQSPQIKGLWRKKRDQN